MHLSAAIFAEACQSGARAMRACEQELNAADARLGDGDTGVTMRRVFDRMAEAAGDPPEDLGVFFRQIGMAAAGATGSSLGTLVAVALIEIGKAVQGRSSIPAGEVVNLLRLAEKVMLTRGGATLGDKTVLDALAAVSSKLEKADAPDLRRQALDAARGVLVDFRDRPCRMGRARMYGERSVGHDDPGMLAFVYLAEAVLEQPAATLPGAPRDPTIPGW